MREAFFILFVVAMLLGLTAVRYRKQIAGMIRLGRLLKSGRISVDSSGRQIRNDEAVPLVNCSKCGIWVPQNKAINVKEVFVCSDACR